jgi:hypothetical protein
MKIKEAIQRLSFTVSKQNKPNTTDAEALNKILEYVNATIKKEVNENELFAKLYVYSLINETVFYKGDIDLAQKRINEILGKSLYSLYESHRDNFNALSFNNYLLQNGLSDKHPLAYNETEQQANKDITKLKDWDFHAKGILEPEENEMQLNWLITLTLNKFKNV